MRRLTHWLGRKLSVAGLRLFLRGMKLQGATGRWVSHRDKSCGCRVVELTVGRAMNDGLPWYGLTEPCPVCSALPTSSDNKVPCGPGR